ncbi:MAG TPA: hypothetical protein VJ553_04110 [Candidatus Paceibacterota bacterium]|nr:hypothetical protein [Candidatus Paceibacterota bacterium]
MSLSQASVEQIRDLLRKAQEALAQAEELMGQSMGGPPVTSLRPRRKRREVTRKDVEVILGRLFRLPEDAEYEKVRNEIACERGLTVNQIGAVLVHLRHNRL